MRSSYWSIGAALALLAAPARADILVYADGKQVEGRVLDVQFLAGKVIGVYTRRVITMMQLGPDGKDVVLLEPGGSRQGTLRSLRFKSDDGIATVVRKSLRQVLLSGSPEPPKRERRRPPPAETPKRDPPKDETPPDELAARKKALQKNLSLRNHYWDQVAELKKDDHQALKTAYKDDCVAVVREMQKINDTIQRKLRRREDADREWRRERDAELRKRREGKKWRDVRRPKHNDGLENDEKALRNAQLKKLKLQKVIRGEQSKISKSAATTRKRLEAVYARLKRALDTGEEATLDEMRQRYQAAYEAHQAYQRTR